MSLRKTLPLSLPQASRGDTGASIAGVGVHVAPLAVIPELDLEWKCARSRRTIYCSSNLYKRKSLSLADLCRWLDRSRGFRFWNWLFCQFGRGIIGLLPDQDQTSCNFVIWPLHLFVVKLLNNIQPRLFDVRSLIILSVWRSACFMDSGNHLGHCLHKTIRTVMWAGRDASKLTLVTYHVDLIGMKMVNWIVSQSDESLLFARHTWMQLIVILWHWILYSFALFHIFRVWVWEMCFDLAFCGCMHGVHFASQL